MRRNSEAGRLWAQGMLCAALLAVALPLRAAQVTGRLQWLQRTELSTLVSGVVKRVSVEPGDRVKRGQVLVALDRRGFKAAAREAVAEVRRRKAALAEARRQRGRAEQMYERTLLAQHDLTLAKIADIRAEAAYRAAQAARVRAELNLEYSEVRAPFDAVVLERHAEVGQTVVTRLQTVPLVVVAAAGKMAARVLLDEAQVAKIAVGQKMDVETAGRHFKGEVAHIALEPVAGSGAPRYPVEVVFAPGDAKLRAGLTAKVQLP